MKAKGPLALSTEQIYDALFDDDAFARLPDLLAQAVNARSAVLAWRYHDGATEVLHHNGYFSDAQFADYTMNYADSDPWVPVAYRPGRMNCAIRMDEEIDPASVRRTAFYNDWLRGIGDDTLHCLGAATTMSGGDGIIGLHRGAGGDGAFTSVEAERFAGVLPHVTRVLVLRGCLMAAAREVRCNRSALDATGLAMVAVDASGQVRMANVAGEVALTDHEWLAPGSRGILSGRPKLANAVALATRRSAPGASAVMLTRADGAQVIANVTPFSPAPSRRDAMIVFRQPVDPVRRNMLLAQLFALTPAEVDVVSLLAEGMTLPSIAARRTTTLETVRSQLRIVRHKTGCGRQAELVALVNRLSS